MQAVYAHLRHFLNRTFTLKSTLIAPDEQLQNDLGLNEWEFMEVIAYLETLFDLTLPDETLVSSLTVEQLCSLIAQYRPDYHGPLDTLSQKAVA